MRLIFRSAFFRSHSGAYFQKIFRNWLSSPKFLKNENCSFQKRFQKIFSLSKHFQTNFIIPRFTVYILHLPVYSYVLAQVSNVTLSEKKTNCIISNCKSELNNASNVVEVYCLQTMKIVHHYANSCFDWLASGQWSVSPPREATSILPRKYKRFTFVYLVLTVAKKIKVTSLICNDTSLS